LTAATPSPFIGAPLVPTMIKLAIPGILGALLQSAMMMVEAGYLRHVGTDALASVAVVFPLVMLAAMFSAGAVGGAVSGATARAMGAGDHQQASAVLWAAIVIAIFAGAAMGILVIVFGPLLYMGTAESAEVAAAASTYAAIVFSSIPLLWLTNMLSAVLRGCGNMVASAMVMGVMVVSYACYAAWLIPTDGATLFEAMRGAGLAMAAAYLTGFVLVTFLMLRKSQPVRLRLSSFNGAVIRAVFRQGALASSQSLMTITYALVATYLFSRHGNDWLAGYGLAVRLEMIMVPMVFGIGSALIAIVGAHVGAGLRERAVSIAWRGVIANGVLIGLFGVAAAVWPQFWCGTFSSGDEVTAICSQSLRAIGPTYGFFALGLCSYFASQALNTLIYPVLGALLRLLIVASALLWYGATYSPQLLLYIVAAAVVSYGVFVVLALWIGPWRTAANQ